VGLGLAICRSIVHAHGGRLWTEANEPRGAAFQFTLPGAPTESGRPFGPVTALESRMNTAHEVVLVERLA
jgi:hypothetical protein